MASPAAPLDEPPYDRPRGDLARIGPPRLEALLLGDTAVLQVIGELDLASAPVLDHELQQLWQTQVAHVILDTRGLDFLDSSGIQVLCKHRAPGSGRRFSIVLGGPAVRRPLEICGMLEHLEVIEPDQMPAAASTRATGVPADQ